MSYYSMLILRAEPTVESCEIVIDLVLTLRSFSSSWFEMVDSNYVSLMNERKSHHWSG